MAITNSHVKYFVVKSLKYEYEYEDCPFYFVLFAANHVFTMQGFSNSFPFYSYKYYYLLVKGVIRVRGEPEKPKSYLKGRNFTESNFCGFGR